MTGSPFTRTPRRRARLAFVMAAMLGASAVVLASQGGPWFLVALGAVGVLALLVAAVIELTADARGGDS